MGQVIPENDQPSLLLVAPHFVALLARLRQEGFQVEPAGQRFTVSPADRLTPALRAEIRAHRDGLRLALEAEEAERLASDSAEALAAYQAARVVEGGPPVARRDLVVAYWEGEPPMVLERATAEAWRDWNAAAARKSRR